MTKTLISVLTKQLNFRAQSGIILNVQHQLEDILNNQQLMLQNQHDMMEKLNDIETRLLDLESRYSLNQRNNHSYNNHRKFKKSNNNTNGHNHINNNNNNNNNHNNSEANSEQLNNSDNNSPNTNNYNDYDQDFIKNEQNNEVMNDDTDTYNDNNESMGSNNDSFEYNDQSQQSQSGNNNNNNNNISFSNNPNINLNNPNLLNDTEVKRIFTIAKSRGNFAALLVQQLYGKHERIISNVMGTRGKRQLSPRRIGIVKKLTFTMYPGVDQNEEEMMWKKECVKAIDSKNRKVKIMPGSNDHLSMQNMYKIELMN
jgi:hypothetical protein